MKLTNLIDGYLSFEIHWKEARLVAEALKHGARSQAAVQEPTDG